MNLVPCLGCNAAGYKNIYQHGFIKCGRMSISSAVFILRGLLELYVSYQTATNVVLGCRPGTCQVNWGVSSELRPNSRPWPRGRDEADWQKNSLLEY